MEAVKTVQDPVNLFKTEILDKLVSRSRPIRDYTILNVETDNETFYEMVSLSRMSLKL
jgi:hypothetical protein